MWSLQALGGLHNSSWQVRIFFYFETYIYVSFTRNGHKCIILYKLKPRVPICVFNGPQLLHSSQYLHFILLLWKKYLMVSPQMNIFFYCNANITLHLKFYIFKVKINNFSLISENEIWIKVRIQSCGFLHIFTYTITDIGIRVTKLAP